MNQAAELLPAGVDFLAAYTAVNNTTWFQALVTIFLAAYTAVNRAHPVPLGAVSFLAAYTAVNPQTAR